MWGTCLGNYWNYADRRFSQFVEGLRDMLGSFRGAVLECFCDMCGRCWGLFREVFRWMLRRGNQKFVQREAIQTKDDHDVIQSTDRKDQLII